MSDLPIVEEARRKSRACAAALEAHLKAPRDPAKLQDLRAVEADFQECSLSYVEVLLQAIEELKNQQS